MKWFILCVEAILYPQMKFYRGFQLTLSIDESICSIMYSFRQTASIPYKEQTNIEINKTNIAKNKIGIDHNFPKNDQNSGTSTL